MSLSEALPGSPWVMAWPGEPVEVAVHHPSQCVKELIQFVGVVEVFTFPGLGVDAVQPHQRVGLPDREIDVDERVAVVEGNCGLRAVVQSDRYLGAKLPPDGVVSFEPRPQTARDDAEATTANACRLFSFTAWSTNGSGARFGSGSGSTPAW